MPLPQGVAAIRNFFGIGSKADQGRKVAPTHGSTTWAGGLGAIFGDLPDKLTDTPRTVTGNYPDTAERINTAPLASMYGWISRPNQTKGMSVLFVDQINRLPNATLVGQTQSTLQRSNDAPFNHYRTSWWLYSGWDPVFRFANTALDMRWSVAKPGTLSNAQPNNLPSGARMGPYNSPFAAAWQIPRFSTEPNTIIPQAGR